MHRASFSFVASCFVGGFAGAQEPIRAGSPLIPHIAVSGALDLRNAATRFAPMSLGTASLEWTTRVPELAVRIEGLYAARGWQSTTYPVECGDVCSRIPGAGMIAFYSSRVRATGAFVGATYDLVRGGALRPFLLAGAGAVQTHHESVASVLVTCPACLIGTNSAPASARMDARPVTGAANVGAGAVYTWPWVSVYAEARYYAVGTRLSRGLNGAVPLSLGVRF